MGNPMLPEDVAVIASVARVHDELFTTLRNPRRRWSGIQRWSALGLAAIVLFGGGLATGAAYVNAHTGISAVPPGLLKIDCASGISARASSSNPYAPRKQVFYFDKATHSLAITPPEPVTVNVAKNPSVACVSEIPRVTGAIGQALPAFAAEGHHCGTITVAGYPTVFFIADNAVRTGQDGQKESGPFATSTMSSKAFAFDGSVATTDCANLTMPAPTPTDPKMVTCEAASNVAMVYLDEKAVGTAATCKQHGYPVWKG
jgi:hypothetical protein